MAILYHYVVLLGVWFSVIWFLFPDSSGRTLEEVAEVFDGPASHNNLVDRIKDNMAADVIRIENVLGNRELP